MVISSLTEFRFQNCKYDLYLLNPFALKYVIVYNIQNIFLVMRQDIFASTMLHDDMNI